MQESSISTEEAPMSPADLADNRRQTPNNKPQNNKTHRPHQTVFLCEIMQHAAFLRLPSTRKSFFNATNVIMSLALCL